MHSPCATLTAHSLRPRQAPKLIQRCTPRRYPDAAKLYTEAILRGPPQVNEECYKLYSNRAACYTKLGAWTEGLKDAEKCIELAPTFSKGYLRKGQVTARNEGILQKG